MIRRKMWLHYYAMKLAIEVATFRNGAFVNGLWKHPVNQLMVRNATFSTTRFPYAAKS